MQHIRDWLTIRENTWDDRVGRSEHVFSYEKTSRNEKIWVFLKFFLVVATRCCMNSSSKCEEICYKYFKNSIRDSLTYVLELTYVLRDYKNPKQITASRRETRMRNGTEWQKRSFKTRFFRNTIFFFFLALFLRTIYEIRIRKYLCSYDRS